MGKDIWMKTGRTAALLGPAVFALFTAIAIYNYSGYTPYANYLSDLGIGKSAMFFNLGVIVAGLCGIMLAIAIHNTLKRNDKWIAIMIACSAIALIGVGVFPEDYGSIHTTVSALFFGLLGIALLFLSHALKGSSYISLVTSIFIFTFLIQHNQPFSEHVAVVSIMIWSITMGFWLKKLMK